MIQIIMQCYILLVLLFGVFTIIYSSITEICVQFSFNYILYNKNICIREEFWERCDNNLKKVFLSNFWNDSSINCKSIPNIKLNGSSYNTEFDRLEIKKYPNSKNENFNFKNISSINLESNSLVKADLELSGPCNIERISRENLFQNEFLDLYAYKKPVIILNATYNKKFQELTKLEELIKLYGHTKIRLSSANSFSYKNKIVTFEEYCQTYLKPQSLSALGNETFYFFGDNSNEDWLDLFESYIFPPYFLPGHFPQSSFGIAGLGSGVPFHFHGPGFAETIWGRKRWFMYPPNFSPSFHPNKTTLQWFLEEYHKAKLDPNFMECTLSPNELIYFPDHWWHATINVDTTVFMSTFLSSLGI